ncbi:MAG TPA: hypothetical protein P5081_00180 [Phycisphaerae bacterium]|nr:hypothetical protein [Phycisphaerae bacterium]HRW51269.1 hypothetical protein [Phycisphaerae bacterium]
MSKRANNYVLGLAVAGVLSILTIGMKWGTFPLEPGFSAEVESPFGSISFGDLSPVTLTVNGTDGSITLFGTIDIPIWAISGLCAAGALIAILRVKDVVTIPRWIPLAVALAGVAMCGFTFYVFVVHGALGLGLVVATLCSVGTLILAASMPLADDAASLGADKFETTH